MNSGPANQLPENNDGGLTHRPLESPDGLLTPVQYVRTVGPQRAALLQNLEIRTAYDLLFHVPHSVNDFSDVRPVPRLEADVEQSVHGLVVDRDARTLKKGRTLVGILLNCNGHFVRGLWFNQPWMLKKVQDNAHVVFSGKPKRHQGRWEFTHPRLHVLADDDDIENAAGVLPRYPLTDGIRMEQMRRMTQAVVEDYVGLVEDPLPESFRRQHRLPDLQTALRWLHQPPTAAQFETARERVLLDDLLEFQLGLALRKREWNQRLTAHRISVSAKIDSRIRRLFGFRLTNGQTEAVREIIEDMGKSQPMHRLLQADVGAGKTAIAVYAMLAAIAAGFQAVLMAPTEVLASQHWDTFDELLAGSRVQRGFLIGGLPAGRKRDLLTQIETGETQLIIGTQAVIQEGVRFHNLALAVIDEQHRFGVRQRAGFADAHPDFNPHVLVMTATPIPRSLCLTRFGDLDVSMIRELPPGRQKVVTARIPTSAEEDRMWNFIRRQITKGRQAYVVCPRIEGQGDDDSAAAEQVFRRLQNAELAGLRIALLHGRMDRDARHEQMDLFRAHEVDVLVSTTVIEVGVNIPNATVMVIQQAESFGLAQLHQLRGRICRGSFQGYCFLVSRSEMPDAIERLSAMEQSSDGFELAEKDADLRGPGDVLGLRQSGALPLRVAHPVRDLSVLHVARRMAFDLVESGDFDHPDFDSLREIVLSRFAELLNLPQTG
ncbi:MAG: ATP-dependent DNA helicase RecG [Planctomycetaceae bacterium]|nr:ATP-dependent DNA helicase RecG [Planctomycetaceae bacterium]